MNLKFILFIAGITLILIIIYLFLPHKVSFELMVKLNGREDQTQTHTNIGFSTITNDEALQSQFTYFPISKNYKYYIDSLSFDFEHFNYLITYGKELKQLKYYWYFVYFVDSCYFRYKKDSIPIKAIYKNSQNADSYICIYRIPKKPIYRNICG